MIPFEVGSRVVCPDPDGGWFIGTVAHVDGAVLTVIYSPTQVVRASAGEVRPVMPRDRRDLDLYGDYWWCRDRVVRVDIGHYGTRVYHCGTDCPDYEIDPSQAWAGPVQPPPEVRS